MQFVAAGGPFLHDEWVMRSRRPTLRAQEKLAQRAPHTSNFPGCCRGVFDHMRAAFSNTRTKRGLAAVAIEQYRFLRNGIRETYSVMNRNAGAWPALGVLNL